MTHTAVERHGFIFLWHGKGPALGDPPWFSELDDSWAYSQRMHTWPTHFTRCVENQLDYAHLPFVHKNTIGGDMDVTRPVDFELSSELIAFYPGGKREGSGNIHFLFPSLWRLLILPGRFAQMIAFVPVDENETRIYLRGYQKFSTLPLLRDLIGAAVQWQNTKILNQDRAVVLSQRPTNTMQALEENLYPSDKAIAFFRKRWSESLGD